MKILRFYFWVFVFGSLPLFANAQTYYQITATSGMQIVGGITVTVSAIGLGGSYTWCDIGPYCDSGSNNNAIAGYKFVFSSPVYAIRSDIEELAGGDTISVYLNGAHYYITSANLSNYTGSCTYNAFNAFAVNGNITDSIHNTLNIVQMNAHPGYGIDSAEIIGTSSTGDGINWDFYFSLNCPGIVSPYAAHDSLCTGDSLYLFAGGNLLSSSATYSWSGPNSFAPTTANPALGNVSLSAAGNYIVTASDTGSCTYTDSVHILVSSPPATPMINTNSPICAGDTLQFTISNLQSGNSYSWTGPNSFSDSIYNPKIYNAALNDSGKYIATATIGSCSAKDSADITIKPIPAKPIATSNSPICANDSLQLTINNLQLSNTYSWTGANSFSSTLSNPTRTNVVLSDSGKYIVKASLNGCTSKPDTIDVSINQLITPFVTISSVPTIIPTGHIDTFTAHTTNCSSPSYQWYKNGIAIPGATTNPYTDSLAAGEHISVQVHCAPCASPDTVSSNMLTTTGVASPLPSPKERVTVWPNPASSVLYIETAEDVYVSILSIEGKALIQDHFVPSRSGGTNGVGLGGLANGLYLVRVYSEEGTLLKVEKFVKE